MNLAIFKTGSFGLNIGQQIVKSLYLGTTEEFESEKSIKPYPTKRRAEIRPARFLLMPHPLHI